MKLLFGITVVLLWNVMGIKTFIIPDELPSILSVIYSNIPTLKKGTDSRIGWGFRLGDRADFQVMVELGPQTYTQKLANQGDDSSTNKRNTLNNLADELYAQRLQEKNQLKTEKNSLNKNGAQWLENWSKTVSEEENDQDSLKPKPGIAIGEIDAKSVLPDDETLEEKEKIKLRTSMKLLQEAIEKHKKKTAASPSLLSILTKGENDSETNANLEKI